MTELSDAAETMAQSFHEHYERLAPEFGYRTREASAVPWDDVPDANKALMVATVMAVIEQHTERVKVTGMALAEPVAPGASAVIVVEGEDGVLMNRYWAGVNAQEVDLTVLMNRYWAGVNAQEVELTMLRGSGSWE